MPYTEMENITPTKLALISERARKEPKLQFTSLAHLLDEGFLKECYFRLGRDRVSGIDGVSWEEYGHDLDNNLKDLVSRMKAKRYKPQPSKRVYIPKDEHSKRPLGLPALEDKVVQKGIAWILEAIYEQDFLDVSYGFRPKRDCHQALNAVDKTIMKGPVNYIIEADIKGYFDNVSHEWLMRCLEVRIKDSSFLLLIKRFLKAGYIDAGEFVLTTQGTPQGGNLSPMLANIFLHYVLDLWFEKRTKLKTKGACNIVRYADDFICMVQSEDDAKYIEQELRVRFSKFNLELHPEKTRVIAFQRGKQKLHHGDKHVPRSFDFLGFTHYWGKSRKGNWILCHKTSSKRFRRACKDLSTWLRNMRCSAKLKEWWPRLQAKLRGHYQYYGISGNGRSLNRYCDATEHIVFKWVNRRSQKVSFTWPEFRRYLNLYPLPQPRIHYNLYTLSPVS